MSDSYESEMSVRQIEPLFRIRRREKEFVSNSKINRGVRLEAVQTKKY